MPSIPPPPSLWVPSKPPSLPKAPRKPLADRVPVIGKVLCAFGLHDVDPGLYIDSHGGLDGLSFCRRCRELDVGRELRFPTFKKPERFG